MQNRSKRNLTNADKPTNIQKWCSCGWCEKKEEYIKSWGEIDVSYMNFAEAKCFCESYGIAPTKKTGSGKNGAILKIDYFHSMRKAWSNNKTLKLPK